MRNHVKVEIRLSRISTAGVFSKGTDGRSGFPFPLRFAGGRFEFVTQAFGDSLKLTSSGLAVSMTNPVVQN